MPVSNFSSQSIVGFIIQKRKFCDHTNRRAGLLMVSFSSSCFSLINSHPFFTNIAHGRHTLRRCNGETATTNSMHIQNYNLNCTVIDSSSSNQNHDYYQPLYLPFVFSSEGEAKSKIARTIFSSFAFAFSFV